MLLSVHMETISPVTGLKQNCLHDYSGVKFNKQEWGL